jgi:hypothetical protein
LTTLLCREFLDSQQSCELFEVFHRSEIKNPRHAHFLCGKIVNQKFCVKKILMLVEIENSLNVKPRYIKDLIKDLLLIPEDCAFHQCGFLGEKAANKNRTGLIIQSFQWQINPVFTVFCKNNSKTDSRGKQPSPNVSASGAYSYRNIGFLLGE